MRRLSWRLRDACQQQVGYEHELTAEEALKRPRRQLQLLHPGLEGTTLDELTTIAARSAVPT